MKTRILIFMLAAFSLVSCKKDIEQEGTAVQDMAGEWYIQYFFNDDLIDPGHYPITTFNTASNVADSLWLEEYAFWGVKGKVKINYSNLEFLSSAPMGEYDAEITGGKIFKNAVVTASKTTTDSIYIQLIDSDITDPADSYSMRGYRRTGFMEDEH